MGNSINRQRTDGLTAARYLSDPAGGYFDGCGRAYYYMPDYQGNNLGVVDADGHLTQRTDYYPYGEAWRQPEADVNPWLYSDKELLSVDGQHEYDFGARRYTPGFPMFTTPDQMSEARPWHSPYLFCGANPVMNTDPTGMNYYAVDRKGYFYLLERNEDSYDRIFSYIQFIECNHNHTSPVYKPSEADVQIAKDYTSKSGECTFTIYSKYSPFVEYNKDSPTGPIDLPEYEFIYTPNKN